MITQDWSMASSLRTARNFAYHSRSYTYWWHVKTGKWRESVCNSHLSATYHHLHSTVLGKELECTVATYVSWYYGIYTMTSSSPNCWFIRLVFLFGCDKHMINNWIVFKSLTLEETISPREYLVAMKHAMRYELFTVRDLTRKLSTESWVYWGTRYTCQEGERMIDHSMRDVATVSYDKLGVPYLYMISSFTFSIT